jgi:hypothetical protein
MTSIASDLRAVATLHRNPLLVRGIRARMRLKHILSWGAVTVSITAFIWFLIYLTGTERQYLDHVEAAKLVIPPIIVIQGIILFVLGTGAVASGLADERADRSLDYQRMSPMPPTAKILGYLFGLPAREYFLFALTLPFLYAAVHISGLPLIKLAHFYVVFFSSVWLYHMTGFVAGMASSKPRRAAMTSLGLVATLYLVLPQLKYVGLNFFQYLTVRPTFVRLITEELNKINPGLEVAARRSIPGFGIETQVYFFDWIIHPTVYALLLQGGLLAALFVVAYRKWRDEEAHSFSKPFAVALHAVACVLVVGSLWPILSRIELVDSFMEQIQGSQRPVPRAFAFEILSMVGLVICGLASLLLTHLVTPSRDTMVKGLRRARKVGRSGLGLASDAASSLPAALIMILLSFGTIAALIHVAMRTGGYFDRLPGIIPLIAPFLLFAAIGLFLHGVRERLSTRAFAVVIFLLWALPFFAMVILMSAEEAFALGWYIGLPCPPVAFFASVVHFMQESTPAAGGPSDFAPNELAPYARGVTYAALMFYGSLALAAQSSLFIRNRQIRATA